MSPWLDIIFMTQSKEIMILVFHIPRISSVGSLPGMCETKVRSAAVTYVTEFSVCVPLATQLYKLWQVAKPSIQDPMAITKTVFTTREGRKPQQHSSMCSLWSTLRFFSLVLIAFSVLFFLIINSNQSSLCTSAFFIVYSYFFLEKRQTTLKTVYTRCWSGHTHSHTHTYTYTNTPVVLVPSCNVTLGIKHLVFCIARYVFYHLSYLLDLTTFYLAQELYYVTR